MAFAGIVLAAALVGCSGGDDGPSQEAMSDALTRYGQKVQSTERIACKLAPDRPGYICDFKAVTCSPYTRKCDKSLLRTGRFVQVSGNWMFMGDISNPSRGYVEPEPSPSASAMVTDLGTTPTPALGPTASASPSPTPTARPTPRANPTPKPSPAPSPKPTPKPTPTPKAMPTGVNRVWLSGRWGGAKGDCAARKAINFGAGGGFYGKRGTGNWTLKGKTVRLTGTYSDNEKSFTQTIKVERTGDGAMTLDGKRYLRCDG